MNEKEAPTAMPNIPTETTTPAAGAGTTLESVNTDRYSPRQGIYQGKETYTTTTPGATLDTDRSHYSPRQGIYQGNNSSAYNTPRASPGNTPRDTYV